MQEFRYSPLPRRDSIRLLHLFTGQPDDPLVGRIQVVRLTHQQDGWTTATPFEAISYVWGSNTKNKDICVDAARLRITTNLSIALRQCRRPDNARVLWADSICINQADLVEKALQVALMARIYSTSQCTLICLGDDCQGRPLARPAAAWLRVLDMALISVFKHPDFSWNMDSFPDTGHDHPALRHQLYEPLRAMLRHPWFTRGWVAQEASLGREALLLWSDVSIPLDEFL